MPKAKKRAAKVAKSPRKAVRARAPMKQPHPAASASKLDLMVAALRGPKGATISDLMELTGWQVHSVRGAIAGALKKRRKVLVTSTKVGGQRLYRIVGRS